MLTGLWRCLGGGGRNKGSESSVTSQWGAVEMPMMLDSKDSGFRGRNKQQEHIQYPSGHKPREVNKVASASTCSEFGLMI